MKHLKLFEATPNVKLRNDFSQFDYLENEIRDILRDEFEYYIDNYGDWSISDFHIRYDKVENIVVTFSLNIEGYLDFENIGPNNLFTVNYGIDGENMLKFMREDIAVILNNELDFNTVDVNYRNENYNFICVLDKSNNRTIKTGLWDAKIKSKE